MKHANANDKGTALLRTRGASIRAQIAVIVMLLAVVPGKVDAAAGGTSSGTRTGDQGRAPAKAQPTVTPLTSGTEPRKVLRLQPKAGDKRIIAFTMKAAMEPSPFTNLPPISGTMQITVKSASANGVINCERVITDVIVPATAQDTESLQEAFSWLKGVRSSGVISSRGYSQWAYMKSPKSDERLPPITRLFLPQIDRGLGIFAGPFPEEAVGAGGKWEVKSGEKESFGPEKVIYEIVSMEERRVTAKTTVTMSASGQKLNQYVAATAGGGGEMTFDLGHIMPATGSLVYRMNMSGNDTPGGTNVSMKVETYFRIEMN